MEKLKFFHERADKNFIFLLLFILIFIGIFMLSFFRADFFKEHIENFEPLKKSITLSLFLLVLMLYGFFIFTKGRKGNAISNVYFVMITVIALATPPFLSRDVAGYLLGANNLVQLHANPYLVNLNHIGLSVWMKELGPIWWLGYPYTYGPVFLAIVSMAVLPNFIHLISAVYLFKALVAGAFLLSVIYFKKVASLLGRDNFTVFLYVLNPAVLISGLVDGHNEIFLILFLLMSFYAILKDEYAKSYLYWAASVFVKYNTLIFLPIFWKKSESISWKRLMISILSGILFFLCFLVIFNLNFNDFLNSFTFFRNQNQCLYVCSPIISTTNILAGKYANVLRYFIFLLFYFFIFYKFILKKYDFLKFTLWSYLGLLFIMTTWLTPWYIIVAIPIGLLIDDKKYKSLVVGLTIYSLIHYFGIF